MNFSDFDITDFFKILYRSLHCDSKIYKRNEEIMLKVPTARYNRTVKKKKTMKNLYFKNRNFLQASDNKVYGDIGNKIQNMEQILNIIIVQFTSYII